MSTLGPGEFVDAASRYRLDSRIATGGMGEVWRGTDTALGREVAVKLLKAEYADHPTFRSRFETEAQHAASLHHPGVASVFDVGEATPTDGSGVHRPYLVMELVDGQPLSALLRPGQPLDTEATRDLMAQAADAIGAAHAAGIVHRDVKPANLLVTPDRTVKITDFGIARATEGMALTETGQVMGTPQYLSPEQAQGGTATPASDVYSLGVVAFECLAGERPFVAETAVATALMHLREPVPDLPSHVPADLAAVVRRAMSKSPEDRFPDATAFAAALRDPSSVAGAAAAAAGAGAAAAGAAAAEPATQVMGSVPPTGATTVAPAAATGPSGPTSGGPGKRLWLWLLLAAAVVAAVVLLVVLAGGDDEEPDPTEPTTSERERPRQTEEPTQEPTEQPTEEPTTEEPTESPSPTPTEEPTTEAPTETPTESPSPTPTEQPTTQAPTATEPTSPPASPAGGEAGSTTQPSDGDTSPQTEEAA
ncbi:serine/threonine-protein kinase [Nocardioides sp. GCM10027113]|uniref:serine/threonine-protein kinase n=1 Tax=unclassified Nocardioides TaxID=2615069 RepID=UPI003613C913